MDKRRSARLVAAPLGGVAACIACAARAHHSVSAWFDTTAMAEVEGVVTEFRWQNPHVVFTLSVPGEQGGTRSGKSRRCRSAASAVGASRAISSTSAIVSASRAIRRAVAPTICSSATSCCRAAARWCSAAPRAGATDTLRGSELLQARDGDGSRPELRIFRTWSTGGVNGVLFPGGRASELRFQPLSAHRGRAHRARGVRFRDRRPDRRLCAERHADDHGAAVSDGNRRPRRHDRATDRGIRLTSSRAHAWPGCWAAAGPRGRRLRSAIPSGPVRGLDARRDDDEGELGSLR